jgi:hypothetical protein
VITDALLGAALAVWNYAVGLLPDGHLSLPSTSGLSTVLGQVDSLVPILGPLQLALTILSAVGVFIAVRLVLVVINIIWP